MQKAQTEQWIKDFESINLTILILMYSETNLRRFYFEALQLYLMILKELNDYDAARKILGYEDLGKLCKLETERLQQLQTVFQLKNDWEQVYEFSKQLLCANGDDWTAYKVLIDSATKLRASNMFESDTLKIFLKENKLSQAGRRGPFLAELLYASSPELNDGTLSLLECIKEYINEFGHTAVCFEDVKEYLRALSSQQKESMINWLTSKLEGSFEELQAQNFIHMMYMF